MSGAGGAGGAAIGSALDGLTWVVPCGSGTSTTRTCSDLPASGSCPTSTDPILKGNVSVNKTVTFNDGAAGGTYTVQVRIRGLAQLRTYTPAGAAGSMGWQAGGAPSAPYSSSIIYAIRVSSPARDYFVNAIATPADYSSDNSAYMLDYTGTMTVDTGATVQLIAADPGCSMAKNCAPPTTSGSCMVQTFTGLTVPGVAQPFNGQFLIMNVLSVTRVVL